MKLQQLTDVPRAGSLQDAMNHERRRMTLASDGARDRERIGADGDLVGHDREGVRKTPRRAAHHPQGAQRGIPDE
jgi:hypothetical protein